MRLHLCIDARMLHSGGIGSYIKGFVPFLSKRMDLTLLVSAEDRDCKEIDSFRFECVSAPVYTLREQISLPRKIPPCDIFWSPHYNIPLIPIPAKKRVVTIHDLCHAEMTGCFSWMKRMGAIFLLDQAYKRSDLVLTVSDFSYQKLAHRYGRDKLHIVYNGVKNKVVAVNTRNIPFPFILYVGNTKRHKNIARLVEAFAQLPDHYHLVLAGKILDPVPYHKRAIVLGEVDEAQLAFLYENAQLLVQPSLYEGFGLTPIEAMNYGCPVVSSLAGGLKESCANAAYPVDPHSTESIYQGIKQVLTNTPLRELLIVRGKERAKLFSLEASAAELEKLLIR